MLAGLLAGTATTLISNPVWVIQTSQAVRTVPDESAPIQKKLGFVQTAKHIVRKDGVSGFWRGIYPALVLGAPNYIVLKSAAFHLTML